MRGAAEPGAVAGDIIGVHLAGVARAVVRGGIELEPLVRRVPREGGGWGRSAERRGRRGDDQHGDVAVSHDGLLGMGRE
jgi:hypothetical protein